MPIVADAPLAPLTTFKVGGPAQWLVQPADGAHVAAAVRVARAHGVRVTILGGGSNVLVADRGVAGLVIRPRGSGINLIGRDLVRADAAVTINGLVRWTIARGCGGLEAWAGTPGTVGGAIYGNAHWRSANIGDVVESVRLADRDGTLRQVPADRLEFGYDTQPAAAHRRSGAVGRVPRPPGRRAGGAAGGGPRVAGLPQAHPAAGLAERRLHLPEPAARPRRGPRRHPALGRRARRSRRAQGPADWRRPRLAARTATSSSTTAAPPPPTSRRWPIAAAPPSASASASRCARRLSGSATGRLARFPEPIMSTLIIEGGCRLSGIVDVEGNKNAALPLMAATLLTREPCTLTNVPRIADVEVMARLLLDLGAEVEGIGSTTLRIQCREVRSHEPDRALVGRLRGSVLLLGPLLARTGRASVAPPGGDFPTRRTIRTHLEALRAMGAVGLDGPGHQLEAPHGLQPASIYLDEASVTGTETAILAAAAAPGTSEIRHCAAEPHVVELCEFLRAMGVGISGEGTHDDPRRRRRPARRRDQGAPRRLHRSRQLGGRRRDHRRRDRDSRRARPRHGSRDLDASASWPCAASSDPGGFCVAPSRLRGAGRITTGLWPGFPSDLVSLVTVLATQAEGATLVHDWMYELRLFALEQMSGMGADLFLCDPHRIIVTGPVPLRGKPLDSRDIRSGMALIAAALAATGESRVEPLETVERGYSRLVERLQSLGARVAKV